MSTATRRGVLMAGTAGLLLPACSGARIETKLDLWDNVSGPHLRGACFPQRRVIPELDGEEFLGAGPVGAPVSDSALQSLAGRGANLAILSHPGIYTERPPYRYDAAVADHLVDLIDRCGRAGLYVVVAFRSGPGRTEFSLHRDEAGSWYPAELLDESLWQSAEACNAWSAMWGHAAVLLQNKANVAGYLLMVEPNANQAALGRDGEAIDIWEPDDLAEAVSGTPGDWPAMAVMLARSIRRHDEVTPILVSPDGYANARFAPLLDLQTVPGMVLAIHDYEPRAYTHGDPDSGAVFDPADALVMPPDAERWIMAEFGVRRWMPGAGSYLAARLESLERAGAASAYFRWDSGWTPYESRENGWNPLYGSDPAAAEPAATSPTLDALAAAWRLNRVRP